MAEVCWVLATSLTGWVLLTLVSHTSRLAAIDEKMATIVSILKGEYDRKRDDGAK